MKILFLDDNEFRHEIFKDRVVGCDVTHVYTYEEAIKALEENVYDEVSLDHDLSELAQTGMQPEQERTGFDVVLYMTEKLPVDKRPKKVYVHSLNPVGSHRMVRELRKAGYENVFYAPFKFQF